MNIYYDVLIIGGKVIVVVGWQLIKQNYFTVVIANRSVITSCILHNRDSESFPTQRVGFVISGEVAVFVATMNL